MNCHDFTEQMNEYALGLLSPEDMRMISDHLANGCESCRQVLNSIDFATSALTSNLPEAKPPAELKSQLMQSLRTRQSTNHISIERQSAYSQMDRVTPSFKENDTDRSIVASVKQTMRFRETLMTIAVCLFGAFLGYSATHLVDAYRRSASELGALDTSSFQASLMARHAKTTGTLRFISLPITSNTQPPKTSAPAGYIAFDLVSKQLHVAVGLEKKPTSSQRFECETIDIDGVHEKLGAFGHVTDSIAMQVFDLPAIESAIAKIVIVEYSNFDREERTRRELLVFDVVSQLSSAAVGNSKVVERP